MKHLGDITKLSGYVAPAVDVVIGGSPCQGLSVAGKQAGLKDERSGLFIEQIRLVKEMRKADAARGKTNDAIRPRYMVWENVPGAFSSNKGRDFEAVLEETVRVAEPKAPPCSCPCERMAHKRMPHGRRMERLKQNSMNNYKQYLEWEKEDKDLALDRLRRCVQDALKEDLRVTDTDDRKGMLSTPGRGPSVYETAAVYSEIFRRARAGRAVAPLAVYSAAKYDETMTAARKRASVMLGL